MDRNDLLATAGETLAYAEDYLETRIELVKLEAAEKGSVAAAGAVTGIVIGTVGLIAILFLSLALATWLGQLLSSAALGFLIVGVIYIIMAVVFYMIKDSVLTRPILQSIIRTLFNDSINVKR